MYPPGKDAQDHELQVQTMELDGCEIVAMDASDDFACVLAVVQDDDCSNNNNNKGVATAKAAPATNAED